MDNNSLFSESSEDNSQRSDPFSLSIRRENASTFFGIFSKKTGSADGESNNSNKTPKSKKKKDVVEINFEWHDKNNDNNDAVYLSGNFCNWKQLFLLEKKDKGVFCLKLPLPRGKYQFRFKINEEWRISPDYPKIPSEDKNIEFNNVIDTTIPPLKKNEKNDKEKGEEDGEETPNKTTEKDICTNSNTNTSRKRESIKISRKFSDDTENTFLDNNSDNEESEECEEEESCSSGASFEINNEMSMDSEEENGIIYKKHDDIKNKLKNIQYSVNYPKRKHYKNIPPNIPYSYDYTLDLDLFSNQNKIGKKKFFDPKEKNIFSGNNSYKSITVLPFIELNHIRSKNIFEISGDVAMCSSFIRYRNKFTTFLYYKPC